MAGTRRSGLVFDLIVGELSGLVIGGIVAVNLVIFLGVEDGYEASLGDMFADGLFTWILVLAVLAAGPIGGVSFARRRRSLERRRRLPRFGGRREIPRSG